MKIQSSALAAVLCVLATPVLAQPVPPPAGPLTPVPQGPPIAGMCIFSQAELMTTSKVGQYASQKYSTINATVNTELNNASQALVSEQSNIKAQIDATGQAANQAAITAFQQKVQQFQDLRDERVDALQRTHDAALQRVLQESTQALQQAYQTKTCSMLIDGDSLLAFSPAMDITPLIVQALDLRITQFDFELLPPQTQGQGAAAPAPAPAPAAGAPAARAPAAPAARTPAGPPRAPAR